MFLYFNTNLSSQKTFTVWFIGFRYFRTGLKKHFHSRGKMELRITCDLKMYSANEKTNNIYFFKLAKKKIKLLKQNYLNH